MNDDYRKRKVSYSNVLLPFHVLIQCLPIDGMACNVIIVYTTWRH